ncbi:tRNA threonylcarbamoyladenosine biosynthesis protein TsaE [Salinihabitans flavidus]|uniref:tRNA threonylcarbamoyladenosine biosynthesis protein TsaE n=1 Tax=Salinihabitans flavidus TaxID=569882 RepID=A0A1H8M0Y7_9RHOB|nr:tRNA (adenosine(37)-N6)-threonylcarbamoyltransferase complex ATPase subunit type 1 TsaE [Salinihabitans flavidus]SEO10806.1 tRNA threonylcarbamoyladenosine biosynthesis protein TsaE [Salinihabitans flavidus]
MPTRTLQLTLSSPEQTCALARRLGACVGAGDVLLLQGGIGAGKTHFARCLIRSLLAEPEDVPSPTFTLVQTYDGLKGEIWHADLYRLSDPAEIEELGLIDAFADCLCLVEWPDRLSGLAPDRSLWFDFSMLQSEGARALTLSWSSPRWDTLQDILIHD